MRFDGSYGTTKIDGTTVNIDTAKVSDLKIYLEKMEKMREDLISEQNDYLGKIIDLKGDK